MCLADDERTEPVVKLCYGLIGDLADAFHGGQLKQLFLQPWIVAELKARHRMNPDVKKTMRWAREVGSCSMFRWRHCFIKHYFFSITDGQASNAVNTRFSRPFSLYPSSGFSFFIHCFFP